MALVNCKECGHEISKNAEVCPNCGAKVKKSSLGGCLLLVVLGFIIIGYIGSTSIPDTTSTPSTTASDSSSSVKSSPAPSPKPKVESQLLLLDWSWHNKRDYAIVEGQVKNISSQSLKNVQAVAQFYTAQKKFITSDSTLIDYNPILPNQTSPFKVYVRWNPEMKSASIDFKTLMGRTIYWEKR